jgi:uncharacterized membrane protein YqjE
MNAWWVAAVAVAIGLVVLGVLMTVQLRRAERTRQLLEHVRGELAAKRSTLHRAAAPIRARRTGHASTARR